MLVEKYKDFDEMFLELNRKFLLHPEIIQTVLGDSGYVENVVIGCKTPKCTLDLANFGYKKSKWGHLLNTYIDYDELQNFYKGLEKVSGLSYTFYFKHKKRNNGSCLISVVLTRKRRHDTWTGMKVYYRVTETQRRMAADLVMLNRFVNELPDCCKIQNVIFFMAQCYCGGKFINGFFDYFGVDRKELNYDHQWIRQLNADYTRYFKTRCEISSFMTLATMQRLYFGIDKYESVDIQSLSIKEHFENPKRRKN